MKYLKRVLDGQDENVIGFDFGAETMVVVAAAHKSAQEKRTVKIDMSKGYNYNSIK